MLKVRVPAEPWIGLSEEQLFELQDALHRDYYNVARDSLQGLHPADIGRLFHLFDPELRIKLLECLTRPLPSDIFISMDDAVREEVLDLLTPAEIAACMEALENSEALSVLEEVGEERRQAILEAIPSAERVMLEETSHYPEESAGRLMEDEVVAIPLSWDVRETLFFLRRNPNLPKIFSEIIVVDEDKKPVGLVSTCILLRTLDLSTAVYTLMKTGFPRISVIADQEDVSVLFREYGVASAPVVNPGGQLVGLIREERVLEVLNEEAEEDLMHLGGVAFSDFYDPLSSTAISRLRWLLATLINALLASAVIGHFQYTLQQIVTLAMLMPIPGAIGGNAGMQVVTVTVRALAMRELNAVNMGRALGKEMAVGLINGLITGSLLGLVAAWLGPPQLGIILGSSVLLNMVWAGFAGTMIPVLIERVGGDPALSSGPLLTTTTDVLGIAFFLGLASFLKP